MSAVMEQSSEQSLVIGVDVGTSAVKLAVVDVSRAREERRHSVVFSCQEAIHYSEPQPSGGLPSPAHRTHHRTQNAANIVEVVRRLLRAVPRELQPRVSRVGVTGQMHGCVTWDASGNCSELVTWEDQRCDPAFLDEVLDKTGHRIHSGYGCATLAWLARNDAEKLSRAVACGTIMDFVVTSLLACSDQGSHQQHWSTVAKMDVTNAASWGLFDLDSRDWDRAALATLGVPEQIMPMPVVVGRRGEEVSNTICGKLQRAQLFEAPCKPDQQEEATISIFAAVGDHPAAVYAILPQTTPGDTGVEETIGLLNVGTSLQFSAVLPPTLNHTRFSNRAAPPSVQSSPKGGDTQRMKTAPASEIRPFFHGQRMLVAAALSGGNSLTTFARSVQGWSKELNPAAKELPLDVVFDALNRTHEELDQAQNKLTGEDQNGLKFDPRFEGERGQPEARASIGNIGAANFTLGHMWASLQDGLIQNVLQMLGGSKRAQELKLSRIICVGGAITRNPRLVRSVERIFGIPAEVAETNSFAGAVGAALLTTQ